MTAADYSREYRDAAVMRVLHAQSGYGPLTATDIAERIREDWCYVPTRGPFPGYPNPNAITPCLRRIRAVRHGRAGYTAPLDQQST